MANNSPTLVMASLSDDQLKKSIESLVTHVDEAMKKMVQSTNNAVGEMEAKLKSLGNVRINSGGANDGGSSRRTSSVEKETKARKELVMTLDQQAAALDKASGKKKGVEYMSLPSDVDKNLTYLVNVNKDVDAQMDAILKKEQALIDAKQKEAQVSEQIASAQRAANSVRGVSAYDLGIDPNVSAGRARQKAGMAAAAKETEYLKQQVASLLEVEEREIKTANTTSSSYAQLAQYLKNLQSAYQRLGADRIAKGEGTDLANEIQRTQRAMQKLQQTMSRPISLKDALGGSEKTLDDIAYKMQRLRAYKQGIDLTKPNATNEIKQVDEALVKLQKDADKWMSKSNEMIKSNTALGRSWNYMKNRLAFYVTVGAGTSFIKQLVEIRSQYEMNEKALGILLDSASRGTRIFNELSQMALVSPYTLIELSNAAKQLTAYDIAAKDVVDTTRRLADMASAVGVPVERLTYALGQIKAYGYLNSRDARMFANAGIPLVKQLADRYSELEGKMVSTADVYDRMKKKAIDYNDVMAVINKMTDEGGKFFDFQAKMAETLKVRLANLTLAWNNMLNDMGKDNQGVMTTGLKGLTVMFKHWRELYRVISTAITALGAYKVATIIAGMATKTSIGGSAVTSWFALARGVKSAKDAVALFSLTLKSIPFTAWVTAIATLASYFILFNNSSDDVKQKLEDIKSAFDGVRKEIETLFADAIKTDNIGTQLTKLRDMLELAETELGVTIPIRLEDVNESNIKQKLKEAKQFVYEYINFSQTFSEAAAGTKFNELMNDFGSKARSTYTNVTESINSVVVALQELSDKGQASKRDIEILNELTSGQKEDESRIEYLQRLISLYEELGLIGQKKVEPMIEHNFFKAFFSSTWDNMEELEQNQEENLDRLGIKNNTVFENMLKDVQEYYSSSSIAAYQFEQQVMRVAEKIDINNIPVEQRTMKLTAAINEEASQNNWNQFEKELARQIANEKFGTTIEISEDSKKTSETELQEWQKKQQKWMDDHGIKITLSFQTNDTEVSYAKRMLQEAKDAADEYQVQLRKLERGTGSQEAVDKALSKKKEARQKYFAAGGDMNELDKKANAAARKAQKAAESELQKALKEEISLIEKVRSIYKDLTKEGMSHANAVERATRGWDETVNAINKVLQKNGLQKLDLSKFAGIENPRELLNILQSQLETLVKRGASTSEIRVLQTKIQTVSVEADKYDLDMITKGLNNELGKLKDEYELAVELDADPELGNAFASMMGINVESLPHTVKEYADRYSTYLNKYLKGKDSALQFTGDELRGLTRDDITAFREQVDAGSFNQEWFDAIKKAYDDIQGKRKKDIEDTEKWKNSLIEKYGNLQDKLTKIYKDSVQNQVNAVKTFGTEDQKSEIVRLQLRLEATDNPAELANINLQIAEIVKDVTDKNPIALKVVTSSKNQEEIDTSKAYWEDFKNSELYTMTFEDMANNSTRAIQLIIDKLNGLKDKVKEDPASMKALIKSLEDAENELNARDPFGGVVRSLRQMAIASQETKTAQEALWRAEVDVEQAQQEVDNAEDGTPEEQAAAQQKLAEAVQRRAAAQVKLTQAENKGKKGTENIRKSLQEMANQLQDVSGLFGSVSQIFKMAGDEDTSEAIDAINEGFTTMVTIIMAVDAAIKIVSTTNPYLLAIAAALSVIVGLVSFLSGNSNKKITEQVEESERAVKRLELAHIDLEHAVQQAYGMATIGANMAAKANKELQLVELKRQLALERSRDSKHRDEDRIIDLQKQIKELEYDIADTVDSIVNDLLGISSIGDAMENMMGAFIEALRSGEDAMATFDESVDEMIANMVKKMFTTKILQPWFEEQWNKIQDQINERAGKLPDELAKVQSKVSVAKMADLDDNNSLVEALRALGMNDEQIHRLIWFNEFGQLDLGEGRNARLRAAYEKLLKEAEQKEAELQKELTTATMPTTDDIRQYAELLRSGQPIMEENMQEVANFLRELGLMKDDANKNLSALQQGIQGITEETAGALEAITNGISQQCYLQSDILIQIRDTVQSFDIDIQTASLSQILLQLQSSYQLQQSMLSTMEGWSNASGSAVKVELIS